MIWDAGATDSILNWAVQTGVTVTLLIIGILIIRRPFTRLFGAGPTYALWSLPILRLFLPVIAIPENWLPARFRNTSETLSTLPPTSLSNPDVTSVTPAAADTAALVADVMNWPLVALCLWLGLAAVWFVFQLIRQRRFIAEIRRASSSIEAALEQESRRAADVTGLSSLPDIRRADANIGPLVTGIIRPLIIVPQSFSEAYSLEQRHFALVHEMAHIKRRDLWAAFAALLFRAMNWFNPVVHYAVHKMRLDQEAACDAYVMARTGRSGGTPHGYAETLLQAARTNGSNPSAAHLALSLAQIEKMKKETSDV